MTEYTPRRANLSRWLQGAPDYVLDVLDSKGSGDRYTVVFTKAMSSVTGSYAETWVSYLGMSGAPTHPQGVSMWGEMEAYKMAQYRASVHKQKATTWRIQSLQDGSNGALVAEIRRDNAGRVWTDVCQHEGSMI